MQRTIDFTRNGKATRVTADEERLLLWVLRDDLGLTGTKFGCGEAHCGACTVIVGKEAVRSCVTPIKDVAGKSVITIEGVRQGTGLHPLQQSFLKHNAFQCGYCTPGMIMSAYALLLKGTQPGRDEIIAHMNNNLCRCGTYNRIVEAVEEASRAKERA